jgi:hypothetical protein
LVDGAAVPPELEVEVPPLSAEPNASCFVDAE